MNPQKQKLVFKLLKEGKIDENEAVMLMQTEKEYIYVPSASPCNPSPLVPYYVTSNGDDSCPIFGNYNPCVDL